jgi:hypothetical protein
MLVGVEGMSGNDDELPKSKAKKPAGSHKVGYKHPPLHSQFKKGTSGNLSGRPKGSVKLHEAILKGWHKKFEVKKNGKTIKMSTAELTTSQLFKSAANGNTSAIGLALKYVEKAEAKAEALGEKLSDHREVKNFVWSEQAELMYKYITGDDDPEINESDDEPDENLNDD